MFKKYCLLLVFVGFMGSAFAGNMPDMQNKTLALESIRFQEKLKSCTPSEHRTSDSYIKIYGIKDGKCRFVSKGQTATGSGTCNFNAPLSEVAQYANYNVKLIKSLYGIDGATMSNSEIKSVSEGMMNFMSKYCKQ